MRLTLNKQTALFIMRNLRKSQPGRDLLKRRCALVDPDPSPRKRWTRKAIDLSVFGIEAPYPNGMPLHVAVSDQVRRMKMSGSVNTVYEAGLPRGSFLQVSQGVRIASPELVFVELAGELPIAQAVMLGNELCGSFGRDPQDPTGANVAMGIPPLTTKAAIQEFIEQTRFIRSINRARRALEYVADNAWSPTESAVATVASLPVEEFGYGLGAYSFNVRVEASDESQQSGAKGSRVPDIVFHETSVGINYDGAMHLELDSIANAAVELGGHPGSRASELALNRAIHKVRAKVIDDIKRNRELMASGYFVFPVVKEDVYETGALDSLMVQVMEAIELSCGRDLSIQKEVVSESLAANKRYKLIRSILPGDAYSSGVVWRDGEAEEGGAVELIVGI